MPKTATARSSALNAYPGQIAGPHCRRGRAIHASGRRIALLGMENAYPLGDSLDELPLWVARGVRYVGLTHIGYNSPPAAPTRSSGCSMPTRIRA